MKAFLAVLALAVMASSASAARLVVIAINSGQTPNQASGAPVPDVNGPADTPGAKGFLIGIDNTADPAAPLAVQDFTFSGPNLVQRQSPNGASLNVQTRGEALLAQLDDPPPTSSFSRNDSWWWTAAQDVDSTPGGQLYGFGPVSTGIQGGEPGGPMTMTGNWVPNPDHSPQNTAPGVWRMAYIVATGNVPISGIIAVGQQGSNMITGELGPKVGSVGMLDFETGAIVPIPEPSTFVLAGLGLVGLALAWRRRK
jgi:hypothetical protein